MHVLTDGSVNWYRCVEELAGVVLKLKIPYEPDLVL